MKFQLLTVFSWVAHVQCADQSVYDKCKKSNETSLHVVQCMWYQDPDVRTKLDQCPKQDSLDASRCFYHVTGMTNDQVELFANLRYKGGMCEENQLRETHKDKSNCKLEEKYWECYNSTVAKANENYKVCLSKELKLTPEEMQKMKDCGLQCPAIKDLQPYYDCTYKCYDKLRVNLGLKAASGQGNSSAQATFTTINALSLLF